MLHLCPNFNQYLPHMESIGTLFYANFNQSVFHCMVLRMIFIPQHDITMAVVWAWDTWHIPGIT